MGSIKRIGPVRPFVTSDKKEYENRKKAFADSAMNYSAAKGFNRIRLTPGDSPERLAAVKSYLGKYHGSPFSYDIVKLGDEGMMPVQKVEYRAPKRTPKPTPRPVVKPVVEEKPKIYNYEVSREVQYPNTEDAQVWRILVGRNEYNLNPDAADFEQYKDPRYRGIPQPVTDSVRNAWNERFRMEPYTKEMTEEEAKELEKQGYTVRRYDFGGPVRPFSTAGIPLDVLIASVRNSDAEFAKRLSSRDTSTMADWGRTGYRANYKMESSDNFVYPNVVKENGRWTDFTRPPYSPDAGYENAMRTGNYVEMPSERDAIWFGENYKYIPEFRNESFKPKFDKGGEPSIMERWKDRRESEHVLDLRDLTPVTSSPVEEAFLSLPALLIAAAFGEENIPDFLKTQRMRNVDEAYRREKEMNKGTDKQTVFPGYFQGELHGNLNFEDGGPVNQEREEEYRRRLQRFFPSIGVYPRSEYSPAGVYLEGRYGQSEDDWRRGRKVPSWSVSADIPIGSAPVNGSRVTSLGVGYDTQRKGKPWNYEVGLGVSKEEGSPADMTGKIGTSYTKYSPKGEFSISGALNYGVPDYNVNNVSKFYPSANLRYVKRFQEGGPTDGGDPMVNVANGDEELIYFGDVLPTLNIYGRESFKPAGEYDIKSCVNGLIKAMSEEYGDVRHLYNIVGNAWDIADNSYGKTIDYNKGLTLKKGDIITFDRESFKSDEEKGVPAHGQHVGFVHRIEDGVPIVRHYVNGKYKDEPVDNVTFSENVKYTPSKITRLPIDPNFVNSAFSPDRNFFGWKDSSHYNEQVNRAMQTLIDLDWSKLGLSESSVKEIANRALSIIGMESDFGKGARSLVRNAFPTVSHLAKQIKRKEFSDKAQGYGSIHNSSFKNVSYDDIESDDGKTRKEKSKETYDRYITPDLVNMLTIGPDKTYNNLHVNNNNTSFILSSLGVENEDAADNIENTTKAIVAMLNNDAKRFGDGSVGDVKFEDQLNRYRGAKNKSANNKALKYYNTLINGEGIGSNFYSKLNAAIDNGSDLKRQVRNNVVSYIANNATFIPPSLRAIAKDVVNDKSEITEDFFLQEDLQENYKMLDAYSDVLRSNGYNYEHFPLQYHDKELNYNPYLMNYEGNDAAYGTVSKGTTKIMDPNMNLQWVVGQGNVTKENDGYVITDTYDFNNKGTAKNLAHAIYQNPTPYGIFRALGTVYGSSPNNGAKVKIHVKKSEFQEGGPVDKASESVQQNGGGLFKKLKKRRQEDKVPLNMPFVFSDTAPEGYYPSVEVDGEYHPLVELPAVEVKANPSPYTPGWYALRPNIYNPYLPLEVQSREAQADYIAQHTREATAKAAPYVAGTLLATAALPYIVSSGIGLAKGIGDFGSFLATTAGRQAALNTGKRLLFDTALGMAGWHASNEVSKDVTGKSLDSHIASGLEYAGVPETAAEIVSPFLNPFGYIGTGFAENVYGASQSLAQKTGEVLSRTRNKAGEAWQNTWNNADNKFVREVFPRRAKRLKLKEIDNLHNEVSQYKKEINDLTDKIDQKSDEYESLIMDAPIKDDEKTLLREQRSLAAKNANTLGPRRELSISKTPEGSNKELIKYTDINGNELSSDVRLHIGELETRLPEKSYTVENGKILDDKIDVNHYDDTKVQYYEPTTNDIQKAVHDDYEKISKDIGENGVVGGSYVLYGNGITGTPHDLEVYTTQNKLRDLEKSLGLGDHSTGRLVENYKSKYKGPAHDVQVCMIEGDAKSSWGHNAEAIYASLHPEEYYALRESYSFGKSGDRITKASRFEIPMSPDQLLQEMKNNPDAVMKKVFIDNIVSGKGKHSSRIAQAAISKPEVIDDCIRTINISSFGRDFTTKELYPLLDFTDVEANKELLGLLGYDEKYATDPKVMESIFRLFDTEATWGVAGVHDIPDKKWAERMINSVTSERNQSGAGANMAKGPVGGGEHYANDGLMTIRKFLLSYESGKIKNMSDYIKQLKRLDATSKLPVSNILSKEQIDTFNSFVKGHGLTYELKADDVAGEWFVKINGIQDFLNKKYGDYEKASNELLKLYEELDLPFLYNSTEYRITRNEGTRPDIVSGGYVGGLSRPIAYGTKNYSLSQTTERLEESPLRMENAQVYDAVDIFNGGNDRFLNQENVDLNDDTRKYLESLIKSSEDAVRQDYTNLFDFNGFRPYYMNEHVLPSPEAREIARSIEGDYRPWIKEAQNTKSNRLGKRMSTEELIREKRKDLYSSSLIDKVDRNINLITYGGSALFIAGLYELYSYLNEQAEVSRRETPKVEQQFDRYLDYYNVPEESHKAVRNELKDELSKRGVYNARRKSMFDIQESLNENPQLIEEILRKYSNDFPEKNR